MSMNLSCCRNHDTFLVAKMTVTEQEITKQALKTAVAQICLTIGWNSIHQTPLNILVDVLHKYVLRSDYIF